MGDISNIKAGALKIQLKAGRSKTYNWMPSQTTPSISNEVIGFKNEERSVLDRLQRGSQQLRVIAIVGMPGQGKTTLAAKVYNHPSTSLYFSVRAWCPISQALDKKKVLCDLLKQIDPNINLEMAEHDLADKLRRCLKGKRYIIFLDDIWNLEAWNTLKDSFPNDSKGSRIIFTSRSLDASPHEMLDQEPLILSELSREESLELLQRKLFPGKGNGWPPQLHDIGMQIAEKCKGLPLSIIILAGILADTEPEGWKKILDSFSLVSSTDYCRYTLELSYKHLPDYLRPCFLYFGAFPEDQEVSVRRLLRIWIGEGFVRKPDMKRHLDDVAEDYLKQLIGRSLIMSVKQRYDGRVKTCRIHDLLREFCLQKAKDEHFFHFLKGYDELLSFNVPHSLRRLCIDSKPEHLHKSKLFCPSARSLLLNCSQQLDFHEGIVYPGESLKLQFFKLLKVLDLESINVGSEFPCAIEQLVLLSFLAIGGGYNLAIPSWIANLSVLETFIVSKLSGAITLPVTFWNMQKLKYLHVGICGILPIENLDNSSVLYELDKISGVVIHWSSVEKLLRKFPNVRCLNCKLYLEGDYADYGDKFVFPGFLSQLESLHVAVCSSIGLYVGFDFSSLTNLKKLALTSVSLYSDFFSIIGEQLPNIEVLKLCNLKFSRGKEEYTWEMKEGEFSKLRVVHLKDMHLRRWITCNDQFECFQKLVIHRCYELEELPCCLESIETLEMIEIRDCHESLENLVIQIQEKQKDWGNSGMTLKIWKSKTRN